MKLTCILTCAMHPVSVIKSPQQGCVDSAAKKFEKQVGKSNEQNAGKIGKFWAK